MNSSTKEIYDKVVDERHILDLTAQCIDMITAKSPQGTKDTLRRVAQKILELVGTAKGSDGPVYRGGFKGHSLPQDSK